MKVFRILNPHTFLMNELFCLKIDCRKSKDSNIYRLKMILILKFKLFNYISFYEYYHPI